VYEYTSWTRIWPTSSPLPNINKDNKAWLRNKQNQAVNKPSGKGHKGSNEIDTYQDDHHGSHHAHHKKNTYIYKNI
jgi:hypothetical protein